MKYVLVNAIIIFFDFQKSSSTRTFDFESLFIVIDLLASFHLESLAYYGVFVLQGIRKVFTFTSSYSYSYPY